MTQTLLGRLGEIATGLLAPAEPPNPSSMSAAEFQALRQLLLLTQAEAGQHVGERPVSERAVQYWEAGKRAIPEDVATGLRELAVLRQQMIGQGLKHLAYGAGVAVWYASAEHWKWRLQDESLWKVHNSTVAELLARGAVRVVRFDPDAYAAWAKEQPLVVARDEWKLHLKWARQVLSAAA